MADWNFPNNPNVGDKYSFDVKTWVWNGSAWDLLTVSDSVLEQVQESLEEMEDILPVFSETPPVAPIRPGQTWVNTTTGRKFLWVTDEDSSQWVEVEASFIIDNKKALAELAKPDGAAKVGFQNGKTAEDKFKELPEASDFPDINAGIESGSLGFAKEYEYSSEINVYNPANLFSLLGGGITQTTPATPNITFRDVSGITVDGLRFTQPKGAPIVPGEGNDHAMLKVKGGGFCAARFNSFDGQYGISYQFSSVGDVNNRRTIHNVAVGNQAVDLEGMFIELGGACYTSVVGNSGYASTQGMHGLRLTGYMLSAGNPIESPCIGNVAAGNAFVGFGRGIAIQNAAKHWNVSAQYIEGATHGIQVIPGTATVSHPTLGIAEFTGRNNNRAIYNQAGHHSVYRVVMDCAACDGPAIEEIAYSGAIGNNSYTAILQNCPFAGALLRYPNNHIDLDVSNSAQGVILSATATGTTGRIRVDQISGNGVSILADGCHLTIKATACSGAYAVAISGSGNVIEVQTDGILSVSGNNNIVTGKVAGTISNTGTGNNLRGILGMSGGGSVLVTPNASGIATINLGAHANANPGFVASAFASGADLTVILTNLSAGVATIKILSGGAPFTSQCRVNYVY